MKYTSLPQVKYPDYLLKDDLCLIGGEQYPQVIGKIVKMMSEGSQPNLANMADPGHGKTFTMARIGEILHNELDILQGPFKPEEQITQDPIKFVSSVKNNKKRFFIVPDADSVFPADEHYTPKNKANRDVIYLSRRTGNLLGYDGHELAKCDKAIRTNHNIRLTSIGTANTYKFRCERIIRENDTQSTEIEKPSLGVWKVDKPSKESIKRIEELDAEEKQAKMGERIEQMENEKKKEKMKKISFTN